MKNQIKEVLKDNLISKTSKAFLVVILLDISLGIWKWNLLPPQLPLFYTLPRGNEQLGTPLLLLLLPLFSLFIFIINFIIASYLYSKEKMAAVLFVIIGFITSLLFLITFVKIIFTIA